LQLCGAIRTDPRFIESILRRAARGAAITDWDPPEWLLDHQTDAATRVGGSLCVFSGALLADAVGLGKTYVSLAIATRYRRTAVVAPASLVSQWKRAADRVRTPITILSHEALSRGRRVPASNLIVVDEAHRFRNPHTRRYHRLACDLGRAHILLVTATPVVNHPRDLASLLRLFLPDNGLAVLGLTSIERAIADRDYDALAHASTPLIVARSLRVLAGGGPQIPRPVDEQPRHPPPLPGRRLHQLIGDIVELGFPGTPDGRAVQLLRNHLLHRLASSTAACRETLRRHLAYLDRALNAFSRGETITRPAARHLFGPGDDLQLELPSLLAPRFLPLAALEVFEEEQYRVLRLLEELPTGIHSNPKADCLEAILEQREARRTIVFVAAVSTALDLARRLRWRRIAVVGGGRAWISSGRVPVETALSLFAPRARRAAEPGRMIRVATLLATDLVSEGLDLQDADGIVHYDLPWTPLGLAQRLGRVARLGSEHTSASVFWFRPPPALERYLRTAHRLGEKADWQLQLGVSATSTIGRAQVLNQMFEYRERIGFPAPDGGPAQSHVPFSIVHGLPCLLLAAQWHLPGGTCRELITVRGDPPQPVRDYRITHTLKRELCSSPPSLSNGSERLMQTALSVLRSRLRAACSHCCDSETVRLKRTILHHARIAGRRRDRVRIELLDGALDRLAMGLAAGPARELNDLAQSGFPNRALLTWLSRHPVRPSLTPSCQVEGFILGAGLGR